MSLVAETIKCVRAMPGFVADWLERQATELFRAQHRPHEVGPPDGVACLRCMEAWPCARLRQLEERSSSGDEETAA
jgi:hypothetical protein